MGPNRLRFNPENKNVLWCVTRIRSIYRDTGELSVCGVWIRLSTSVRDLGFRRLRRHINCRYYYYYYYYYHYCYYYCYYYHYPAPKKAGEVFIYASPALKKPDKFRIRWRRCIYIYTV